MKRLALVLPGLLIGFLLGRIGPAREKLALEESLTKAEQRAEDAERRANARPQPIFMPGMGEVLPGAPGSRPTQPHPERTPPSAPPPADEVTGADTGAPPAPPPPPSPEAIQEEFELAVEAQRLRAAQNRAALIEQADLDDAQIEAVDHAVARMNDELALLGDELYAMATSGADPDPTEMLGLSHEVTGILYEAQLGLEDAVGQDALRDIQPEAGQIWNYVDLEAFRDTIEGAQ
ncbi:MAG: hypothetical protein VX899_24360 [Myxococcota bacterium]|nr:hypothetical protein [Myxococcota bacterium]